MASSDMPLTARPAVRFLDRATPPHIATLILIAGLSADVTVDTRSKPR